MIRESILPRPSKTIYINVFYSPRVRLAIYSAFIFFACIILSILGLAIKSGLDFRATQTAYAVSTLHRAQTLTAIPTLTSTMTPTITPTFTLTPTPTNTPTPTATPEMSWSKSVVDSGSNRPGYFLSMGINSQDKYYIAYLLDRSDDLMVVEGNGKSWKPLRNLSQLNREGRSVGFFVNLAVGDGESPYLTYFIYDKGIARGVFPTSDGTWSTANIGENLNVLDMRIAMDSKSIPHFAILTRNGDLYYRSASTNLIKVDTGVLPPQSLRSSINYYPVTLAVDALQHPYLCYSKVGEIQCKYHLDNTWRTTGTLKDGVFPSLQIDTAGNLHLAYYDYQEQLLTYALLPIGEAYWRTSVVDNNGDVGFFPSLKIDENDLVHISYYDVENTSLKYALGQLGGWSVYTIDNDGNVGLTSSLVIDSQGNPAIAYFDSERRRIYFLKGQQK